MSASDEKSFTDIKTEDNVLVQSASAEESMGQDHFATWLYHAKLQRESEDLSIVGGGLKTEHGEMMTNSTASDSPEVVERMQARRSLRTATAFAAFFLVSYIPSSLVHLKGFRTRDRELLPPGFDRFF